jgi:predicted neuraminidase
MGKFPNDYTPVTAENLDGTEKVLIDDLGTRSVTLNELSDFFGPGGGGASDLADLGDVEVGTPSDGQALVWDAGTSKWVPGVVSGGPTELDQITDVNVPTPSNGQLLGFNGTEWTNVNAPGGVSEEDLDAAIADFRTEAEINTLIASAAGNFKGVATPATNPGTPTTPEFYLTAEAGTYTNFGAQVVAANRFAVLAWNGTTWQKSEVAISSTAQTTYGTVTALTGFSSTDTTGNRTFINQLLPSVNPGSVKSISFRGGSSAGALKIKFFKKMSDTPLIFREIKSIDTTNTAATSKTLTAGVDYTEFAVEANTYVGAWYAAAAGSVAYRNLTSGYAFVTGDTTTLGDAAVTAGNREVGVNFVVETNLGAALGNKATDLLYADNTEPVIIDEDKLTTFGFDADPDDVTNPDVEVNPAATIVHNFYIANGTSAPSAATGAAYIKIPYTPGQVLRISGMTRKDGAPDARFLTAVQYWNGSDVRVGTGISVTGAIGDETPDDIVTSSTGAVTQAIVTIRRGPVEAPWYFTAWDMSKLEISLDGVPVVQYRHRQIVTEINGKKLHAELETQTAFLTALSRIEYLEKHQFTRLYFGEIIPGTEEHGRVDQGVVIRLANGNLLLAHNYFDDTIGDDAPSNILVWSSTNDGFTWSQIGLISKGTNVAVQGPSLYQQADGTVICMFMTKTDSGDHSYIGLATSSDSGVTWSDVSNLTVNDDSRFLVVRNDAIYKIPVGQTNAGRLLFPFSELRYDLIPTYAEPKSIRYLYSDDDGDTWTEHATQLTDTTISTRSVSEPGFFHNDSNQLVLFVRSSAANVRHWVSADGGATFTSADPTILMTAQSSSSAIKYISAIDKWVAITHDPADSGTQYQQRQNLRIRLSDDGITWTTHPRKLYIYDGSHSANEPSILEDVRLGGLLVTYALYNAADDYSFGRTFIPYYDLLAAY